MPGRIGEIVRIVAYEVVRLVEIDRLGVLRPVVNGSVKAEHGILAGCQREIIPVAGELPQCLDYRTKSRKTTSPVSGSVMIHGLLETEL